MSKLGLNEEQAHGSIAAATDTVKEAMAGGHGFSLENAASLFSNAQNTPGADNMLSNITNAVSGKLTGQVGLNPDQAGGVSSMIMPMITNMLTQKIGGNAGGLQSLIGGLTGGSGGLGGIASGLVGKLFS
jgi:hypothetical protein